MTFSSRSKYISAREPSSKTATRFSHSSHEIRISVFNTVYLCRKQAETSAEPDPLLRRRVALRKTTGGDHYGSRRTPAAPAPLVRASSGVFVFECRMRVDPLKTVEWQRSRARSEEHTSELQSRPHLVCR